MKKQSEWMRQPGLDKLLDQLVHELGCSPAELNAYVAAKALGIDPSGPFYKKFRDWQKRRIAETEQPEIEVPAHVQAGFRETLDRFTGEAMESYLRAIRGASGDFHRSAERRVAEAERRAHDAEAGEGELIDRLIEAERERDAELERATKLEQDLIAACRREDILTARLEERDVLLKALAFAPADEREAPRPVDDAASADAEASRTPRVMEAMIDPIVADAEQPSAIETGDPEDGQAEMPFDPTDIDDKSDAGVDDQG